MILGRNPALWLGLVAAALNVLVLVVGIHLDAQQLAALNAFAAAIIGVLANETANGTAGTFDLTTKPPVKGP